MIFYNLIDDSTVICVFNTKKTSNLFPKTGSHKIYMRFSGVIGYKKYGLEKL